MQCKYLLGMLHEGRGARRTLAQYISQSADWNNHQHILLAVSSEAATEIGRFKGNLGLTFSQAITTK